MPPKGDAKFAWMLHMIHYWASAGASRGDLLAPDPCAIASSVALIRRLMDLNPSRPLRKGDVAPYLDMANMPTLGHAPDSVVRRSFGSGMRFANGDTLVARITPCLENGKAAYVDFLQDDEIFASKRRRRGCSWCWTCPRTRRNG